MQQYNDNIYISFYECDCGQSWMGTWDCACDDQCSACGADVEATDYMKINIEHFNRTPEHSCPVCLAPEKINVLAYVEGGLLTAARSNVQADRLEFQVWDQDNIDEGWYGDSDDADEWEENDCFPSITPEGYRDWDDFSENEDSPVPYGVY